MKEIVFRQDNNPIYTFFFFKLVVERIKHTNFKFWSFNLKICGP